MADELLDLQKLTFFTEGNTFTGSKTKPGPHPALLRYLVRPDRKEDLLFAYTWNTDVCFEKADSCREASFPLNEQGLEELGKWLTQQYAEI